MKSTELNLALTCSACGKPVNATIGNAVTGGPTPLIVDPCLTCIPDGDPANFEEDLPEHDDEPEEVEVDLVINRQDRQVIRLTAK